MFSFLSFRDWIHIILLKFLTWYDFIFTPIYTFNVVTDSIIPDEIITEILLRLPLKSLSKFTCVSKSWNQLISSPHFVINHLKLNSSHHRVLFRGINGNVKFCSLPNLFNKQQVTEELYDMDSPVENLTYIVGSVNGLICMFNHTSETYIWNPTISKSKKLLNSTWGSSFSIKCGFGYDESRDDYKVVFVDCCRHTSRNVISIYSLRTDSWRTVHDQLQGIFLINNFGKFVNGKLYWASSSARPGKYVVRKITSFDLADETWGSVELPIYREADCHFRLGVVGSDLSLLYTCHLGDATSDVWILKDCRFWTKLFTIKYPHNVGLSILMYSPPIDTFSIRFRQSNKGDILLFLHSIIMIYDGSTRQLKHTVDVDGCHAQEIYVESLINPLTISGQGTRIHETSQSLR